MDDRPAIDLDPAQLLAAAPRDEYALLELELGWSELEEVEERVAARLRMFVVTRDPLDWIPGRGPAWATANADGDVLELVVYVALDAVRHGLADDGDVAATVARYAAAAVRSGAASEDLLISGAQPALAAAGRVPRLLDRLDHTSTRSVSQRYVCVPRDGSRSGSAPSKTWFRTPSVQSTSTARSSDSTRSSPTTPTARLAAATGSASPETSRLHGRCCAHRTALRRWQ